MKIKKCIYKVNEEADISRLYSIVKATNNWINSGETCVICLGHSRPNTDDNDPDDIGIAVGELNNLRVQNSEIWADLWIDEKWVDFVKDGRWTKLSAEVWDDDIISCVALLSKNRPKLDLGKINYQIYQQPKRDFNMKKYTLEEKGEDMGLSIEETKQMINEQFMHSECYAKIAETLQTTIPQLMEKVSKLEEALAPLMMEDEPEKNQSEQDELMNQGDGKDKTATEMKEGQPLSSEQKEAVSKVKENEKEEGGPEKQQMANASANNTYVPSLKEKDKDDKDDEKEDEPLIVKYQKQKSFATNLQERLLKAEEELYAIKEAANEENKAVLSKYQKEKRKNEITELAKDKLVNVEEELKYVEDMDDTQFENHKKLICAKYQRIKTGFVPDIDRRIPEGGSKSVDDTVIRAEKAARARKIALETGCSFKEAMDKIN